MRCTRSQPARSSICPEDIPSAGGVYALLLTLAHARTLSVGALGPVALAPGWYCYVGSARRGLRARIGRHLAERTSRHWHIDYLLRYTEPVAVVCCGTSLTIECTIAGHLATRFVGIPDFGSSDCCCASHLYFSEDYARARRAIEKAFRLCGCHPLVVGARAGVRT